MLQITIPGTEYYDEKAELFVTAKETVLQLEHSLISLSKWESKWNKPFLGKDQKTAEECADYVRCMTLTQNVDPVVYNGVTPGLYELVNRYIEAPMSATWFKNSKGGPLNREVVTAEIIYYWMIALNIPFECQKWHLNRLVTLIRVCNLKNAPQKKMSRKDVLSRNRALNASRRQNLRTKG
jgi:hypothetical protein